MLARKVKDYSNYFVREDGLVWTTNYNKFLKSAKVKGGYRMVNLCKDATKFNALVHRVVAEAFIPNPGNLPQVNHIDGDKTNNKVSNLEWVTAKQNMTHSFESLHNYPISFKTVQAIREYAKTTNNISKISREFNVARASVRAFINNTRRSEK